MSFASNLLGSTVRQVGGEEAALEALMTPKKCLGLYFSAHWCPPCRQFTPLLSKWYKEGLKDKMQLVFVSSDKDEDQFNEYASSMSFPALPFALRDKQKELTRKFGLKGIPGLVVLDTSGNVITTNGRERATEDNLGEKFPEGWKNKGPLELVKDITFTSAAGDVPATTLINNYEVLALFFSAEWCPPCHEFEVALLPWVEKAKAKGLNLEVLLMPMDKTEDEYAKHTARLPYPSVPYSRLPCCHSIAQAYDIHSLPTLAIVDAKTFTMINPNGRTLPEDDPEGEQYPWKSEAVKDLEGPDGEAIEDVPCLIVFDNSNLQKCDLKFLAEEIKSKYSIITFYSRREGPVYEQLSALMEDGQEKKVVLLDASDDGSYYIFDAVPNEEELLHFVKEFTEENLPKFHLKE